MKTLPLFNSVSANFQRKPSDEDAAQVEKFHVLALSRIEENSSEYERERGIIRRPSIKVDNWDLIYTETGKGGCLGPVENCCKSEGAPNPGKPKTNER